MSSAGKLKDLFALSATLQALLKTTTAAETKNFIHVAAYDEYETGNGPLPRVFVKRGIISFSPLTDQFVAMGDVAFRIVLPIEAVDTMLVHHEEQAEWAEDTLIAIVQDVIRSSRLQGTDTRLEYHGATLGILERTHPDVSESEGDVFVCDGNFAYGNP